MCPLAAGKRFSPLSWPQRPCCSLQVTHGSNLASYIHYNHIMLAAVGADVIILDGDPPALGANATTWPVRGNVSRSSATCPVHKRTPFVGANNTTYVVVERKCPGKCKHNSGWSSAPTQQLVHGRVQCCVLGCSTGLDMSLKFVCDMQCGGYVPAPHILWLPCWVSAAAALSSCSSQ
jgi:hypothetical protein